jgi:hypothetical protein
VDRHVRVAVAARGQAVVDDDAGIGRDTTVGVDEQGIDRKFARWP